VYRSAATLAGRGGCVDGMPKEMPGRFVAAARAAGEGAEWRDESSSESAREQKRARALRNRRWKYCVVGCARPRLAKAARGTRPRGGLHRGAKGGGSACIRFWSVILRAD